ncbi:MAG: lipid-A-disaccharide synthase [Acidiferrobacterales bacterium]
MTQSILTVRIGVVAGEVSGDLLGARLMKALKRRLPGIQFEGIGGPEMEALGCRSLFPMERLSVLGLTEVLGRYFELRRVRSRLRRYFLSNPPDLFIGIDSPGFNLGLEHALKRAGIRTMHYVSPQVWAWRSYRVRKIRKSVDRMLALFPFEERFYRDHGVPVEFVGHPLADEIPLRVDIRDARERLKLLPGQTVVALLPGSRVGELRAHADVFVKTALWLHQRHPHMLFVAPFVNRQTRQIFENAIRDNAAWDLPLTRMFGHSRDAVAAADAVLVASGTATLEALLLKRLMVVTYRVSWVSYWLIRVFSHVENYSMPNNLAGRALVPELLQGDAVPEKLGAEIEKQLARGARERATLKAFGEIHKELRRDASEKAADAVLALLGRETSRA